MNYLCAFLLLAFAAGSVHSSFCINPEYYKQAILNRLQEQCASYFPLHFGTLPLINPVRSLLGSVTKLTGVWLDEVIDLSASLVNNNLKAELNLPVGSDQVPAVNVKLIIRVKIMFYKESGCSLLRTSSSPVIKMAIIDNPPLGIDLNLLDALLTSVTNAVTPTVEHILKVVLLAINCPAKSFADVQMIGGEPCKLELQEVHTENGLVKGKCCLITKEGSECSDGTVELEDNALSVLAITNGMLKRILTLACQHSQYTVRVPKQLLGDLANQYGNDMLLRMSPAEINDCSFTPDGADVQITVNVDLSAIKERAQTLLSIRIKVGLNAKMTHGNGYWSIQLETEEMLAARTSGLRTTLALEPTVSKDNCGCQVSVLTWLLDFISCNLKAFIGNINAKLNPCMKLPIPGGMTPTTTKIATNQNQCFLIFS